MSVSELQGITGRQGPGLQAEIDARDEPLPFLSNFQDIFLTTGLVIFLVGVGMSLTIVGRDFMTDARSSAFTVAGLSAVILLLVYWLSDVLVRKRRRILPGIVLNVSFLTLIFLIFGNLYGAILGENVIEDMKNVVWDENPFDPVAASGGVTDAQLRAVADAGRDALPWSVKGFFISAPLLILAAAFFYYRRFLLPFAAGTTGMAAVIALWAIAFVAFPYDVVRWSPTITFAQGLVLLIAAIGYDMRDPERETRFSGNGFWLNLFAAPLILNGALTIATIGFVYDISGLANDPEAAAQSVDPLSATQSLVTLGIIGLFAIISLLLNRRALLVAGLFSAGFAIWVLSRETGLGGLETTAVTLVVLGAGVLLLGIGWNAARRALLTFVPSGGVFGRIFPRETADG